MRKIMKKKFKNADVESLYLALCESLGSSERDLLDELLAKIK
jgi:hypothetical protein